MKTSRTAAYMALFRAIESAQHPGHRLFNDPFSIYFLHGWLKLAARIARLPLLRQLLIAYIERYWTGAFTAGIARTRFIDDTIAQAAQSDINQVILLGAGYDCRAHRLLLPNVQFVEVDHPCTQQLKKKQIGRFYEKEGNLPIKPVDYVAVDFNDAQLGAIAPAMLQRAYYKTLFVVEELTNYITEAAVNDVLRYIKGFPAGTRVVFTYMDKRVIDNTGAFSGTSKLFRTLARNREQWTFGILPDKLEAYLTARHFKLLYDGGAADYRYAYFGKQKAAAMKGFEYQRIAVAELLPGQ
ncbi:class I SAM-dependent methyltransferase [Chitinophaga costaii]|uniref:class I SAM-dependent methyltransferase n=1 Tax=Chitinophaga costaii TaxID=1335309 RepID=UPI0013FDBF25|nr:SAM-dependent methyltransferase [Chitinophaga costaii]